MATKLGFLWPKKSKKRERTCTFEVRVNCERLSRKVGRLLDALHVEERNAIAIEALKVIVQCRGQLAEGDGMANEACRFARMEGAVYRASARTRVSSATG